MSNRRRTCRTILPSMILLLPLPPLRLEGAEWQISPYSSSAGQQQMSTQTTDCQTHNGYSNTSQDAYFGHILSEVQPGTFRVATINVNNLSTFSNDAKDLAFSSDIQRCELDVVLVQEIGVNWSKLDRRNQFHERMKDHFEQGTMRAKLSLNSHDKSGSAKQWGCEDST